MIEHFLLRDAVRSSVERYINQVDDTDLISNLYNLTFEQVEIELLKTVMEHADQNQTLATKMLGISRATLRTKLQKYDLMKHK